MQCSGMQWDAVRCSGMQWDAAGHSRMWQDTVGCCGMQWDAAGCSRLLWDAVGCSGAKPSCWQEFTRGLKVQCSHSSSGMAWQKGCALPVQHVRRWFSRTGIKESRKHSW